MFRIMESERKCTYCLKEFSTVSSKNRHERNFNGAMLTTKTKRFVCPLCDHEPFPARSKLIEHFQSFLDIDIEENTYHFRNITEYESWKALENREVDFRLSERRKSSNKTDERLYYNCNRSDYKGFVSTCQKRSPKCGGSIKIKGICPARFVATIYHEGPVVVSFTKTHVGHTDELRSKRLSKSEEKGIANQLIAGVSTERIIQDARIVEEGDSYPGLKEEDFAVAYMNGVMEKKLRDHKRLVCIDGTHGTNRNNFDLTIVLVKDTENMGFPVAFLISNRLDQTIQEIFFNALKVRLGEALETEFIMTDDDPKYYNAWVKAMGIEQKPRRLLCTWHVIKNWNIQGRSKIKNPDIKKEAKIRMYNILREPDEAQFMELKQEFFSHLEDKGENKFLKYLQTYYFKSEERIMMWAHCFRKHAGINTNMAIESLNKVLKYNKMNGKRNIRVEKLLDLLEELVEERIWKRIVNTEQPSSNNYQHKVTVAAHMRAKLIFDKVVETTGDGKYKVQAGSGSDKFYFITFNELCDVDCRTNYCDACKICMHRFKCECSEYAVKGVLCQSDMVQDNDERMLYVSEPSTSGLKYQEEVNHFIEEISQTKEKTNANSETTRKLALETAFNEIKSFAEDLDDNEFNKYLDYLMKPSRNSVNKNMSRKRKNEKQSYYPNKKYN